MEMQPNLILAVLIFLGLIAAAVLAWISVFVRFALGLPVLPAFRPRVVPWGAGTVLGAIVLWLAMQAGAGLAYRAARPGPPGADPAAARPALRPIETMGLSAAGNVAAVLAIVALAAATSGARPRDFGVEAEGAPTRFAQGVIAYPLLAPCVFGLMLLAVMIWGKNNHPLQDAMTDDRSPGTVALLVFAGVVMAPLSEELLFRGILLGWLTRKSLGPGAVAKPVSEADRDWADFGMGPVPAATVDAPRMIDPEAGSYLTPIVVDEIDASAELVAAPPAPPDADPFDPFRPGGAAHVAPKAGTAGLGWLRARLILANFAVSLVFALLHAPQWPAPVPLLVLSMGLGVLYQRTGSLIGPIALHMTFNGVSTLLMFLSVGNPLAPAPAPAPKAIPAPVPPPARAEEVAVRGRWLVDSAPPSVMIQPVPRKGV